LKVRNLEQFHLRPPIILSVLLLILVAVGIFSLSLGRYHVPAATVARILFESVATDVLPNSLSSQETEWIVVRIIRLPRILVVILAGMGLALSGAALQGLFRNPLVGPQIVGVSSGASFGGVLAILLSLPAAGIVGFAFAFGILTLLLVYGLSRLAGRAGGILALVLAGVILSSFFSALVGVVQYLADPETKLPGIVYWLMGSFAAADWAKVPVIGIPTLAAGVLLMLLRWRINLLSLGDIDAAALGVNVGMLRWFILGLVSLIVAAQVSVSGGVGWVGLVIPHLTRMLVGPDHRTLLPASALLGGIYLLLMDCLARNLTMLEIPIGLLTALVGTPFFALLFWKTQARGWGRD
jgi:iron complex transport system permease protein